MSIVCKFGGSSVADARGFRQVRQIVRQDAHRRYIVLSAPGRRWTDDEKITDMLYRCHADKSAFRQVAARYAELASELGLEKSVRIWLKEAEDMLSVSRDAAASRGEYLCAKLFAAWMNMPFVDAAELMRFDENGDLDEAKTRAAIRETLSDLPFAVIPGFYGAMPDGAIRTFRRGGSDITGAWIAAALNAELYENWTDVNGVLDADPRMFSDAETVERISYAQMHLLAECGACVLHPDSIPPLREYHIPTRICNTRNAAHAGTLLTEYCRASKVCMSGTADGEIARICVVWGGDMQWKSRLLRALGDMPTGVYFPQTDGMVVCVHSEDYRKASECLHDAVRTIS